MSRLGWCWEPFSTEHVETYWLMKNCLTQFENPMKEWVHNFSVMAALAIKFGKMYRIEFSANDVFGLATTGCHLWRVS